jgi:hypothetical protein
VLDRDGLLHPQQDEEPMDRLEDRGALSAADADEPFRRAAGAACRVFAKLVCAS